MNSSTHRVSLVQVFDALYASSGADVCTDECVSDALHQCNLAQPDAVESLQAQLAGQKLSSRQSGALRLAHSVLTRYFSQPAFAEPLGQQMLANAGALAADALEKSGWLQQDGSRIIGVLDELAEVAIGWSPSMSDAESVRARMLKVMTSLGSSRMNAEVASFRRWHISAKVRAEKVAERTLAAERGGLRTDYARAVAVKTLRTQVAGRLLPEFMDEDIRAVWLPALQWVVLNRGDKSDLWRRLLRNFSLLIWSVLEDSGAQKQRLHRVVDQLKKDLPDLLEEVTGDPVLRERVLDRIDEAHLNMINEREMGYAYPAVLEEDLRLNHLEVDISEDLLNEVLALTPEQWFGHAGSRMHLCCREEAYRQLVFVNQLGIKVLRCSYEEFSYLYASGDIQPIGECVPLKECVREGVSRMLSQYKEALSAGIRQEKAANRAEAREMAREKARREARALLEQEQAGMMDVGGSNLSSLLEEFDDGYAERRQRARLQVAGMIVGSWLDFVSDDGSRQRRKLLVVLPSSNKFIFVDRSCSDKLQLSRDELVDGLAEGRLILLQNDARFDDALNRVLVSSIAASDTGQLN